MKLIKTFNSDIDAKYFAEDFREKGILVFVSSKYSRSLSSGQTGALTSEAWIVLKSQYEDAFNLKNDKEYIVRNPLTEEEMIYLEKNTALLKRLPSPSIELAKYLIGALALIFIFIIFLEVIDA